MRSDDVAMKEGGVLLDSWGVYDREAREQCDVMLTGIHIRFSCSYFSTFP
jgi:hypothetical protein